jgi:hypothetical protein
MDRSTVYWESLSLRPVDVEDFVGSVRAHILGCLITGATGVLMGGTASAEDIERR